MRATCLVLLAAGLAASTVTASAQYNPSGSYSPPGPYQGAPLDDDETEGPGAYTPPPGAVARPGAYESQPLPPVGQGGYAQPAPPPGQSGYAQPLPPPPTPYGQQPGYGPPPAPAPYRDTYQVPQAGPPTAVARQGQTWEAPMRPPGEIGAGGPPSYGAVGPGPNPAPNYGAPPFAGRPVEADRAPVGSIPGAVPNAAPGQAAAPAGPNSAYASLPPDYRPEEGQPKELDPRFRRQVVDFPTNEPAGTLIVDTPNTHLYLVLGNGKAMRYGIGVGREGFTWSGVEKISRMAEWPDWHPPQEMIDRQPYLPRFMAGGESNPMGARALYLGKTVYRIHGTNQPSTIGTFVSSGCIRLVNEDIEDLYRRVSVGTRVVVMPKQGGAQAPRSPIPGNAGLPQVIR